MPACGQNRFEGVVRMTVILGSPKQACLKAIEDGESEGLRLMRQFQKANKLCPDECSHRTVATETTKVVRVDGRWAEGGYRATALVQYTCVIICSHHPSPPPPPEPVLPQGWSSDSTGTPTWTEPDPPPSEPVQPEVPCCDAFCTCQGSHCPIPPPHDHCPAHLSEGDDNAASDFGCAMQGGRCILPATHTQGMMPSQHQCRHGHVF